LTRVLAAIPAACDVWWKRVAAEQEVLCQSPAWKLVMESTMRPHHVTPIRGDDEIAVEERRTICVLIVTFWSLVKIMYLLRTGALDSLEALSLAFAGVRAVSQTLVVVVCGGLSYGVYLVLSRFRSARTSAQVAVTALCTVGFVLALSVYGDVMESIGVIESRIGWTARVRETAVQGWAPFTLFSAAVLTIIKTNETRRRERQAAALERAVHEARLRALRHQVDPHFLYNTLNSVSTLILDGRYGQADEMVMRLSEFFRTSLANNGAGDVTLERELALQSAYLEIEKIRFGEQLDVHFDMPDGLANALVPSFILQPLVENVVKHGLGASDATTRLTVSAARADGRLRLEVENRGSSRASKGGSGIGLRNVRDRLQARFGADHCFAPSPLPEGGFRVRIELPLTFADAR